MWTRVSVRAFLVPAQLRLRRLCWTSRKQRTKTVSRTQVRTYKCRLAWLCAHTQVFITYSDGHVHTHTYIYTYIHVHTRSRSRARTGAAAAAAADATSGAAEKAESDNEEDLFYTYELTAVLRHKVQCMHACIAYSEGACIAHNAPERKAERSSNGYVYA